jgi:hypothetical protein
MFRRLRRLEERMAPKPDAVSQRTAELIRERRRRRLDAAGQPYEELPWHTVELAPGRRLSIAETLLIGRRHYRHAHAGRDATMTFRMGGRGWKSRRNPK